MDAKSIGATIARLRKKKGITQSELAQRLNVSDKAVSRWENGLGYPEVTQFPSIADVFSVTVDYLMTGERKGIAIAGNILTDIVKTIDCYPESGMLANIVEMSKAVGGCVPNTAINLAKIDSSIPICALGKIGDDDYGRFLLSQLAKYGIDCEKICVSESQPTSFSDVMSQTSGERTFFHARGSNTEFSPDDIDISSLNCLMLHIGYILLLDAFDKDDEQYGTVMARFLHDARKAGIRTSVDVVSDSVADYKKKVYPALKYCSFAIMNEVESGRIFSIDPYGTDGKLDVKKIQHIAELMAEAGVEEKVIIHAKEAGFCYDVATGEFTVVPSLNIPPELIKGSVGAGDSYCAACLYSLYRGFTDKEMLEFASSAAACNLFAENSVDGMLPKEEIVKLADKYGRKTI